MTTVGVRYIVEDVREAADFYTERLGFTVAIDAAPGFAALERGELRLYLNPPKGPGTASQPTPDGRVPEPGGWNRFQILVDDIDAEVARLKHADAAFRTDVVRGNAGSQVLVEDPSGNLVELFQPAT
ncbi:VOC family protein [Aeromicrobium sp.]|uniref:VOC family protein n=1 Tax=Aeromicrobium sp. TaxID=1871063 RepID=UPI003D6B22BB